MQVRYNSTSEVHRFDITRIGVVVMRVSSKFTSRSYFVSQLSFTDCEKLAEVTVVESCITKAFYADAAMGWITSVDRQDE